MKNLCARRDDRPGDGRIEHSGLAEVIKTADWVIDLGPEGGDKGGEVVAEGTPEQVAKEARSYTGGYLGPLLAKSGPADQPALAKLGRRRRASTPKAQRSHETVG